MHIITMAPQTTGDADGSQQQKKKNDSPSPDSSYMVKPYQGFLEVIGRFAVEEGMMMLPMEFVREYSKELSDTAIVSVPSGCSWKLGFTKRSINNSVWFDEGFHHFMRYHSIDYGHYLAFTYKGMSCFKVRIYKADGGEISYLRQEPRHDGNGCHCNTPLHHHDQCQHHDRSGDGGNDADNGKRVVLISNGERGQSNKRKGPSSSHQRPMQHTCFDSNDVEIGERIDDSRMGQGPVVVEEEPGFASKRRAVGGNEMTRNDELARPPQHVCNHDEADKLLAPHIEEIQMFDPAKFFATLDLMSPESKKAVHEASLMKLKNPCFLVVLNPAGGKQPQLYIPMEFVKMHMVSASSQRIIIQPTDTKEPGSGWTVYAYAPTDGGMMMMLGCQGFVRDNYLKTGDVCVFELISSSKEPPPVFKVSIVRATPSDRPH